MNTPNTTRSSARRPRLASLMSRLAVDVGLLAMIPALMAFAWWSGRASLEAALAGSGAGAQVTAALAAVLDAQAVWALMMVAAALAAAIMVLFHLRRMIVIPLRQKLIENNTAIEHQKKLTHFARLATGLAHEIRNPLTAINVRLHSLKKNLTENSSEQEDALVIGHEIQRLERIVQEFLQFARPAEPKLLTVSADSLLAKVQSLFGPQLEKNSIRLTVESVPDVWVRVDPHQIQQVLINLIQNAAESMERDGAITLRVRRDAARLTGRTRPVVIVEVSDTGKGIPPEVQKRMFDPFFTTKEEGTGLGLAIASRIVETHGGTLECRSEVNRGTTFTIVLPQTKSEEINEPAT